MLVLQLFFTKGQENKGNSATNKTHIGLQSHVRILPTPMTETVKEKRSSENEPTKESIGEATDKKKTHKRRRNYDEHDAEVAKDEKTEKGSGDKEKAEEDDESDLDDAKLDAMVDQDEAEDDLAEIDTSNIITTGRRTRGKVIDYKKTAAELEKSKEENEEEDADFKE